jgi:Ca2+-binding RTX toxin-like protein
MGAGSIAYGTIETLNIGLGSDADTFTIVSTHGGATTVDGNDGADIVNVQAISGTTTVNGGNDGDTVNVGHNGTIDGVNALLTVNGGAGGDTMSVDDSTPGNIHKIGTLTSSTLRGLELEQGIDYFGLETLNIALAGGNNSFNIRSTSAATTVDAGEGNDNIFVGSAAPAAGGTVDAISGNLFVNGGGGSDSLILSDSGDTNPNTGTLTATTIAGLDMLGLITYSSISTLTIGLGGGADTFTIESTHANATTVNANGGADTFNVRTIDGATTVDGGNDPDTFNVGDAGGTVNGIQAPLTVRGQNHTGNGDTLNVDDSGDTGPNAGTLTATAITGLGMLAGITYETIEAVNIGLGAGADVFNVRSTSALTNLNTGAGDDRIFVSSLASATAANADDIDFLAGNLNGIAGTLNIDAGADRNALMVSDEAAGAGDASVLITDVLAAAAAIVPNVAANAEVFITGLAQGAITYRAAANGTFAGGITVWSGSANDAFLVNGSHEREGVRTVTTLNTGLGNDSVTLDLDTGEDGFFVLNTQGPNNSLPAANDNDFVDGSASTQSLVVFGGQGNDNITGGQNDDILFGDRGRVVYFDREITALEAETLTDAELEALGVAVFGHGGPGDKTDGVIRRLGLVFSVDPSVGGGDTVNGLEGRDIVFGGAAGDTLGAGASDSQSDVILGDSGRARFVEDILVDIASINPDIGGNDTITAGNGANYIIGGKGEDTIVAGGDAEADVIVGDNGRAQFAPVSGIVLSIESIAAEHGDDDTITAGNGPNTIIGGSGDDGITAGNGTAADVIIGDNGKALFAGGRLVSIETTDFSYGGADTIFAGNGPDVVLGGAADDTIDAGLDGSRDVVLGDDGLALFTAAGVLTEIRSLAPELGGIDEIVVGEGDDVVVGGSMTDYINVDRDTLDNIGVDSGRDVIVGDNGFARFDAASGQSLLLEIRAIFETHGDDDFIFAANGQDTVLGGAGDDIIDAGTDASRDIVLGDNGFGLFDLVTVGGEQRSVLRQVSSEQTHLGGQDQIVVGDGDDVVIGGKDTDYINFTRPALPGDTPQPIGTDTGADVMVGDSGSALFDTATGTSLVLRIETLDALNGDDDFIFAGNGPDTVLGGSGDDLLVAGGTDTASDIVLGDNGWATFTAARAVIQITSTDPLEGGNDVITTGNGPDVVLGGSGRDIVLAAATDAAAHAFFGLVGTSFTITPALLAQLIATGVGDGARDVVLGDSGEVQFFDDALNTPSLIKTASPETGDIDLINVGNGPDVVMGGSADDLILAGGNDAESDIVLGDNGEAHFLGAFRLERILSDAAEEGGNDIITTGNGPDVVLGGSLQDIVLAAATDSAVNPFLGLLGAGTILITPALVDALIATGAGDAARDVVLGDSGEVQFFDDALNTPALIRTTEHGTGGIDLINVGNGPDVVLAGDEDDLILAGGTDAASDIVLGDNGEAHFFGAFILDKVVSDAAAGGNDIITTGNGPDVVLGGSFQDIVLAAADDAAAVAFLDLLGAGAIVITPALVADLIETGAGDEARDVVLGDSGEVQFFDDALNAPKLVRTISPESGGIDLINVGDGSDVVMGGSGDDLILAGGTDAASDIVLGDNGEAHFFGAFILDRILSDTPEEGAEEQGGNDVITTGNGPDVVLGGSFQDIVLAAADDAAAVAFLNLLGAGTIAITPALVADLIDTGAGDAARDVVLGDSGEVQFFDDALNAPRLVKTILPLTGGVDLINVGNGPDVVMGGSGDDLVLAGGDDAASDIVLGDNGEAHFLGAFILEKIFSTAFAEGGNDVITTGNGPDVVLGGSGNDIVLAAADDAAAVAFLDLLGAGTIVITPALVADLIATGAGDAARDVVLGDSGEVQFFDDALNTPSLISTLSPETGGIDLINVGNGSDVVMGGSADDVVLAGGDDAAADIVLGDNGTASFAGAFVLDEIVSDATEGDGNDIITTGNGPDVVLGGARSDIILAAANDAAAIAFLDLLGTGSISITPALVADLIATGAGDAARDVVLGDSGRAKFADNVLVEIEATAHELGDEVIDDDLINVGNGPDVVMGGGDDDLVLAGGNDAVTDIVLGDDGMATFTTAGVLIEIHTTAPADGGNDIITVGDGADVVMGGSGDDIILAASNDAVASAFLDLLATPDYVITPALVNALLALAVGDDAADIVLGDNGKASFTNGVLARIDSTDGAAGGRDAISTGNGPDVVIAGRANDLVLAGGNDDAEDRVIGDSGRITFDGSEAFRAGEESSIISFNFTGEGDAVWVSGTAGAPGAAAGNWNNLNGGGYSVYGNEEDELVRFDDGSIAAGVSIAWGVDLGTSNRGGAHTDNHSEILAGDDQDLRLFNGYLYSSTHDTLGVDLLGLRGQFESYDVYVYLDADDDHSRLGESVRSINGITLNDPDGQTFAGVYQEGTNYVVFRGVTSDVFSLRIDDVGTSSNNRPALNGLQVVGRHYAINRFETTFAGEGGDDFIVTAGGPDIVLGGKGNDQIHTYGPAVRGAVDGDMVAGDNASVTLVLGQVADFRTTDPAHAGNDTIVTGNGNDLVLGGEGSDTIRTGVEGAYDNGQVQIISINFGAEAGESTVTGTAGAVQAGNWNNPLTGNAHWNDPDFFNALRFASGALATGVAITWGQDLDSSWHSEAADVSGHDQVDANTENGRLFEGYLTADHHETLGVNITGLGGLGTYDVYVYIDGDDHSSHHDNAVRRVSAGGTVFHLADAEGHAFAGEFVEGGNYVVFRNVSGNTFKLRIDDASPYHHHGHNHPVLNAIQIVAGAGKNSVAVGGDTDEDVVVGDSGRVQLHQGAIVQVESTEIANVAAGVDADSIATGEGRDIVIAGNGADTINAGAGDDIVIGDNARVTLYQGRVAGLAHEEEHGWQLNDHHHHHDHHGHGYDHDHHHHHHDDDHHDHDDHHGHGDHHDHGDHDDDDHHWSHHHDHDHDHHDHGHHYGHDHGFDGYDVVGIELLGSDVGGNDTIEGGADDDLMYGQFGDDTYVFAGSQLGNDRVVEAGDYDHGLPNDLHDRLDFSGYAQAIEINLETSDKQYFAAGSALTLSSSSAIEGVVGSAFDDEIDGNDRVNFLFGRAGDDEIAGDDGDDWLHGDAGNDRLYGENGNDRLDGGAGNDKHDGGSGQDLLIFPGATVGVTVTFSGTGKGTVNVDGQGGVDTMASSVEGAIGTAYNDTLKGHYGDDELHGMAGNDTITGGDGDDTIAGGTGNDSIDAGKDDDLVLWNEGDGADTLIEMGDGSYDRLLVTLGTGNDVVTLAGAGTNKVSIGLPGVTLILTRGDVIEIDTGAGDDVVTVGNLGTTDVNEVVVRFGQGNDRLEAGATRTDVRAYGDAGDDRFVGGSGDDHFDGGAGSDWIDYSTATARVKVDLEDGEADEDGRGGEDELCAIENVKGSAFSDYIWGDDCDNIIDAGAGNDQVWAGGGNDVVRGEAGDDKLYGEDGDDLLDGGDGKDELYGGNGDDVLVGGAGSDTIDGGSGYDLLGFPGVHGVTVNITSGGKGTATHALTGTDTLRGGVNGVVDAANHLVTLSTSTDSHGHYHGYCTPWWWWLC